MTNINKKKTVKGAHKGGGGGEGGGGAWVGGGIKWRK